MYNEHYFEDDYDYDKEPAIYSGALRHIQDHLEVVLDTLYGDGWIDLDKLENSLDEVVNGLGLSLPKNDLMVERRRFKISGTFVDAFIDTKLYQPKSDTGLCQKILA